jgi:hypothetical protein
MLRAVRNWSVDETRFKNESPELYQIWRLEQLINFGLDGEKLDPRLLKKYWDRLSIDADAKRFLFFLLWPQNKTS